MNLVLTQWTSQDIISKNIDMLVSGRKTKTSYPTTALVFGYPFKTKSK